MNKFDNFYIRLAPFLILKPSNIEFILKVFIERPFCPKEAYIFVQQSSVTLS